MVEALDALVDALPRIAEMATQEERAAVVAWIRGVAEMSRDWSEHTWVYDGLADDIERGEHRREENE
jgi:hypothetical protein